MEFAQTTLGEHVIHIPAFMYVRDHGGNSDGHVFSLTGANRMPEPHPLKLGTDRDVRFIRGEIFIRPHLIVATDIYQGYMPNQMLTDFPDVDRMLRNGEKLLDLGLYDHEES